MPPQFNRESHGLVAIVVLLLRIAGTCYCSDDIFFIKESTPSKASDQHQTNNVTVSEYDDIELVCVFKTRAFGNNGTWLYRGWNESGVNPRRIFKESQNNRTVQPGIATPAPGTAEIHLTIRNSSMADAGEYTCALGPIEGDNNFHATKSIWVTVYPFITGRNTSSASTPDEQEAVNVFTNRMPIAVSDSLLIAIFVPLLIAVVISVVLLAAYYRRYQSRKVMQSSNVLYRANESDEMDRQLVPDEPVDQDWLDKEISHQRLHILEPIGEGAHAEVFKGIISYGVEQILVAVKMLKGNDEPLGANNFGRDKENFRREAKLMMKLCHENLINFYGHCTTMDGSFLVLVEFAPAGNLKQFLKRCQLKEKQETLYTDDDLTTTITHANKRKNSTASDYLEPLSIMDKPIISINKLACFASQVARGMNFLGSQKVIHRDLAARNVLVMENYTLKICDFGLARLARPPTDNKEDDYYYKLRSFARLPVKWMAPESLMENTYTSKSDVWSFGVLLWEIYSLGADPYPSVCPEDIIEHVVNANMRMSKPTDADETMYATMMQCWKLSATERPTFAELLDRFSQRVYTSVATMDHSSLVSTVEIDSGQAEEYDEYDDDEYDDDVFNTTQSSVDSSTMDSQYASMPVVTTSV